MKMLTLFFLTVSCLSCQAANVQWSSLVVEKPGVDWPFRVYEYGFGIPLFYVRVVHDALTDSYTLSFKTPEDPRLLGYENPYMGNMNLYENMVFAKEGDIVSSATTRSLDDSKYAVHYGIDDKRYFFGELANVEPNTDIYLSYICSVDPLGEDPNCFYGWVSMSLDNEGSIHAYGAFDFDGGPMIVGGGAWEGATPEPASGLLLLLGGALLALRRRPVRRRRHA